MMTSSINGNIFRVTGHLCGEFTAQRPMTRSFDVSFDLRLKKRLSKQSRGRLFEMPSRSLWRHCNVVLARHRPAVNIMAVDILVRNTCQAFSKHHADFWVSHFIRWTAGSLTHYGDVIMVAIASQITSLTIVYSTVYSDADQRKHQSFASLAFVRGIHRWIPRKRASHAEHASICWRHENYPFICEKQIFLLRNVSFVVKLVYFT